MLARLGLTVCLAFAAPQEPRAPGVELVPLAERLKLRTLTSEIAKCGDTALIARMRTVLRSLGDEEGELEALEDGWQRAAVGAKPSRTLRPALANKLRRTLEPLAAGLEDATEPARSALARCLLALDGDEPKANAVLGRVRDKDGAWRTAEELRWVEGARAIAEKMGTAAKLDFEIERGKSTNPTLRVTSGGGSFVRAGGLQLDSALPLEVLERILRQALRAADLSRGILGLTALPRPILRRFVLLQSRQELPAALDEAGEKGGLERDAYRRLLDLHLESFYDDRDWETLGWRSEAAVAAFLLWRQQEDWIPPDAQPCLRVGHVNWLCLRFLGTQIPDLAWVEDPAAGPHANATAAVMDEAARQPLWRCTRESLFGCRAWMLQRVRAGADPSWTRAMLDQDGKIRGEERLKTTLVCEMLQEEGRLGPLIAEARGPRDPVKRIEAALGQGLPELEQRWRRWIDPPDPRGVVQELEDAGPTKGATAADALLQTLDGARARALYGRGATEERLTLDAELSRAAEAHARYLTRNPSQRERWPQLHEELANAPGFSAAGALAGSRALIAFGTDPAEVVPTWLGTYYHRLPLLRPGLFGVGFGRCEDVIVLETGSLVASPDQERVVLWPPPDAKDVPRRFVPELPSPVPDADMKTLGYPVTVQLERVAPEEDVRLELELFAERVDGERVEGHRLAPDSALELAPRDAWGWIPSRPLGAHARYVARARWSDPAGQQERVWSFTTGE